MLIGLFSIGGANETAKTFNIFVFLGAFLIVLGVLFWWFVLGSTTDTNITDYNKIALLNPMLPSIVSFKEHTDIRFLHYQDRLLFFQSDAYTLVVQYENDVYLEEKAALDEKYTFQTEPVLDDTTGWRTTTFTIDSFSFRMLSFDDYDLSYPKYMMFIGTSDETCEIAYVYFCDQDRDYIDGSFENFLRESCRWR